MKDKNTILTESRDVFKDLCNVVMLEMNFLGKYTYELTLNERDALKRIINKINN